MGVKRFFMDRLRESGINLCAKSLFRTFFEHQKLKDNALDLNTHKLENYCRKIGAYSLCGQDLNWHKNGQHRNLEIKHPILLLVLVLTKLNWLKAMVQDKSAYNEKR